MRLNEPWAVEHSASHRQRCCTVSVCSVVSRTLLVLCWYFFISWCAAGFVQVQRMLKLLQACRLPEVLASLQALCGLPAKSLGPQPLSRCLLSDTPPASPLAGLHNSLSCLPTESRSPSRSRGFSGGRLALVNFVRVLPVAGFLGSFHFLFMPCVSWTTLRCLVLAAACIPYLSSIGSAQLNIPVSECSPTCKHDCSTRLPHVSSLSPFIDARHQVHPCWANYCPCPCKVGVFWSSCAMRPHEHFSERK